MIGMVIHSIICCKLPKFTTTKVQALVVRLICDLVRENPALPANIEFELEVILSYRLFSS